MFWGVIKIQNLVYMELPIVTMVNTQRLPLCLVSSVAKKAVEPGAAAPATRRAAPLTPAASWGRSQTS